MRTSIFILCFWLTTLGLRAQGYILLPMDEAQTNHLKAYGITYKVLELKQEAWWLLNYRGGSFAFPYSDVFKKECITRGVRFEVLAEAKFNNILNQIADPEVNMEAMKLEVPPKVAVYSPTVNARGKEIQPWDDAVTLVLTYAEIPYDLVYDDEVLDMKLPEYDWLHLHHEDFTGQYGKFYASYNNQQWYREYVRNMENLAEKHGFNKVSQLKLAVVKRIQEFVAGGGFMFAMCSATDTYDIALAAEGVDICDHMYDGDPADPQAQAKLDFSKTFAFKDFQLVRDPYKYEYSTIDASPMTAPARRVPDKQDYFNLFEFSAKWDPVPSMLTQCHNRTVKGFMGQTTAFRKTQLKSNVLVLGDNKAAKEARYIHGTFQKGFFSFYGGHDPEDYRHFVHDPATDLNLHPNSEGYRLILNNVLFPAAKKKKRKT
ncbi:hypothetical protein SapgrDRAFT_1450 [Saprospira grandis DSM 2844]|uniref:Asparagine synthetase B n=1 Tax=Saprospira grandis DSM 2844 TaxID=694433 RepID=J0XVY4_9BACT|nr:hypothetical protein [Saprospira grandis]EJF53166.1 hypothetical protein SapgrDRAFT_1450 [Saprospira grandis DSM 2844]